MPECIYGKPVMFFAPENDETPEEFGWLSLVHLFCATFLAGAEGLEPSARGFGDRCSTN